MNKWQVVTKRTNKIYDTWSEANYWYSKAIKMGVKAKIVELKGE